MLKSAEGPFCKGFKSARGFSENHHHCRHSTHGMAPVPWCRRVDHRPVATGAPLPIPRGQAAAHRAPPSLPPCSLFSPAANPNPSPRSLPPWPPPPPFASPAIQAASDPDEAAVVSASTSATSPRKELGRGARNRRRRPHPLRLGPPPSSTYASPSGLLRPRRARLHAPGERAHLPDLSSLLLSLSVLLAPRATAGRRGHGRRSSLR